VLDLTEAEEGEGDSLRDKLVPEGDAATKPPERGMAEEEVERIKAGSSFGLCGAGSLKLCTDIEGFAVVKVLLRGAFASPAASKEEDDEEEDEEGEATLSEEEERDDEEDEEESSSSDVRMICLDWTIRSGDRYPQERTQESKPEDSRFCRNRDEISFQTSVKRWFVLALSLDDATNRAQSS